MPLAGGNATATTINVFLHTRRYSSNGNMLTYWDDVVGYHAYVPPAPSVSAVGDYSLDVDVNPGANASNPQAEFGITIGGGAYTLGTDWVQPDGTVGGSPAWQTDANWGIRTVTGLTAGTEYTFEVRARYSSSVTQETWSGPGASGMPIPEPATLLLALGLGLVAARRR